MSPIRIYLDTSDYIGLLSPKPGSIQAGIKQQLFDWLDNDQIEIGYSFWIVTEFIKDGDPEFRNDRRRKGELLKQLARGKAFPHFLDLKAGCRFPNRGIWMPRSALDAFKGDFFKDALVESIKADPRLNRSFKRKLSTLSGIRELLVINGHLRTLRRSDYPVPVTDEFIEGRYFERYLEGEISNRQLQRALTKWFADPAEYFELWHQHMGKDSPIDEMVDKFHGKFVEGAQKMWREIREAKEAAMRAKKSYREYRATLRESDLPLEVLHAIPKLEKPDTTVALPELKVSKAFAEIVPVGQAEYIDEYAQAIISGRKPERGDIVDMMHLQYIFYCDLFRCDKRNAKLFKRSTSLPSERIVPKLSELPDRIAAELERAVG